MENKQLQAELNKLKLVTPALETDGLIGAKTMRAVDRLLDDSTSRLKGDPDSWSDARKRVAAQQLIYAFAGIEVGNIDGLVGEQTRYAASVWDARQKNVGNVVDAVEKWRDTEKPNDSNDNLLRVLPPNTAKYAWPAQKAVTSFFGSPGDASKQRMITLPFPQRIAWEPSQTVTRVTCHALVGPALVSIWQQTLEQYGYDQIKKLRLDMFGGCLNVRKMRGGSAWSMHSWGIAWDIDPDRNQLKFTRAQATLDNEEYTQFWKIVYAHGARSLGLEKNYDWMHFQFTKDFS